MSKVSKESIAPFLKYFDKKFLNLKEIKSIGDLAKLPIFAYKFFTKNDTKIISKLFDINVIEDLSKLDKEKPFDQFFSLDATEDPIKQAKIVEKMRKQIDILTEKIPNLETKLKKGIIISDVIARTAKKKEPIKKKETKIICVGLENAGKTAILSRFGGRLGIQELSKLKPTKKVKRRVVETKDLTLLIWDFGGQEIYRKMYLKEPEKYFFQTHLVLYVIDVQDPNKFDESFEYFSQILEIFKIFEEKPYFLIFIHKSDPDLRETPEFQLNVEIAKVGINDLFKERYMEFEVFTSSIYDLISSEPKFARFLKDVLRDQQSLTNPTLEKVEGLGKILDSTLTAVIRLSENIMVEFDGIYKRFEALENQFKAGLSAPPPEQPKATETDSQSTRTTVLNELKELFQKRKKVNY